MTLIKSPLGVGIVGKCTTLNQGSRSTLLFMLQRQESSLVKFVIKILETHKVYLNISNFIQENQMALKRKDIGVNIVIDNFTQEKM